MKGDGSEPDRLALVAGSYLRAKAGVKSAQARLKDAKAAAKSHGFSVKPLIAALNDLALSPKDLEEKRRDEEEAIQLRELYFEHLRELPTPLEQYIADQEAAGVTLEDVDE
jgi:hypothetical protein